MLDRIMKMAVWAATLVLLLGCMAFSAGSVLAEETAGSEGKETDVGDELITDLSPDRGLPGCAGLPAVVIEEDERLKTYEIVLFIVLGLAIIHLSCSFVTRHIAKKKGMEGGFSWGLLMGIVGIIVLSLKKSGDRVSVPVRE